jgi:hypothetical protein
MANVGHSTSPGADGSGRTLDRFAEATPVLKIENCNTRAGWDLETKPNASSSFGVALVREVPEAMKPRRIAIEVAGNDNQQIEQKQAA